MATVPKPLPVEAHTANGVKVASRYAKLVWLTVRTLGSRFAET